MMFASGDMVSSKHSGLNVWTTSTTDPIFSIDTLDVSDLCLVLTHANRYEVVVVTLRMKVGLVSVSHMVLR